MVSTDLNLNPETIIRLYSYRFKIECTFRELKQVIGAFSYQFWSKSMPMLNRFKRKDEIDAIDKVKAEKVKERIICTLNAGLSITKIIKNKQVKPLFYEDLQAS